MIFSSKNTSFQMESSLMIDQCIGIISEKTVSPWAFWVPGIVSKRKNNTQFIFWRRRKLFNPMKGKFLIDLVGKNNGTEISINQVNTIGSIFIKLWCIIFLAPSIALIIKLAYDIFALNLDEGRCLFFLSLLLAIAIGVVINIVYVTLRIGDFTKVRFFIQSNMGKIHKEST